MTREIRRVAILAYRAPEHPGAGGMELHLQQWSEALARRGAEVTIITSTHPGLLEDSGPGRRTLFLRGTPVGRLNRDWFQRSREAFERLHGERPFDAVLSESTAGWTVLRLPRGRRPPGLLILHGFQPDHLSSEWHDAHGPTGLAKLLLIKVPETLYYSRVERDCARRCDRVLAIAGHVRDKVWTRYGVPADKFLLVPNRVDTAAFSPSPERRQEWRRSLGLGPGDRVIVMHGTVTRQKGFHLGLRAFARCLAREPALWMIVAGDGPYLGEIRDLAARLGISGRVKMMGGLPHHRIAGPLNASDIYLLSSLRAEGMSYAQLEAMACGLPLVAAPGAGLEEAMGTAGILAARADDDSLAEAILRLARSPDLRATLGRLARERALGRFDQRNLGEDLGAAFEGLS